MTTVDQNNMEDFDTTMAVNLRGTMLSMKYAAQAMIPAKQGVIICTASTLGILPDQPTNYAISKAAVIAAVRSAASDLGQYGIRVNCISPTVVATPLPLRYLRWESLPVESNVYYTTTTNPKLVVISRQNWRVISQCRQSKLWRKFIK